MDITPPISSDLQVVQVYHATGFLVSNTRWEGAVLVAARVTRPWLVEGAPAAWPAGAAAPTGLFQALAATLRDATAAGDAPELVVLGVGAGQRFVPPACRRLVAVQGVALEAMPTGAACRTYNVLMAEGRRVLAALLPEI